MQHVHDCEAGIKADKVSKLKWTHRVIGAELHGVASIEATLPTPS